MNCEILNVGTELLLGDIVNTNAQFLSKELATLGIDVNYICTVGDNEQRLREALKAGLQNSDMVITTGGLGPTADDITKEVCSSVFDLPLELHQESLDRMIAYFKNFAHPMPETNRKQVQMPQGAAVFNNNFGTAPGCAIEKDGKVIIMLPGPPRELGPMFHGGVKPFLQQFSDSVIVSHNVRTFGVGESAMAEKVADLLENSNPTVAPYAKEGEALLRVTAKAQTQEQAEALIRPVLDEIQKRFTHLIYGIDSENLEQRIVELLTEAKKTVAVAESCTGGYLAKRITDIAGASNVFACGVVSYSNTIKEQVLHVSHEDLEQVGAVSEQVAQQMAKGVYQLSGASIGIGTTGISGPGSDGTDKPVGLSYIALTDGEYIWCKKISTGREGQRSLNRHVTSSNALNMIRLYFDGTLDTEDVTKINF